MHIQTMRYTTSKQLSFMPWAESATQDDYEFMKVMLQVRYKFESTDCRGVDCTEEEVTINGIPFNQFQDTLSYSLYDVSRSLDPVKLITYLQNLLDEATEDVMSSSEWESSYETEDNEYNMDR